MKLNRRRKKLSQTAMLSAIVTGLVMSPLAMAQPSGAPRMRMARLAYPTGDMATSVIALERTMPVEVRVGETFSYTVRLTNLTTKRVDELVLTEKLPDGFAVSRIEPTASPDPTGTVRWSLGSLSPRAATEVRITGTPTGTGEISSCSTVTFSTTACSGVQVVQPALQLIKQTPPEVLLCDPIPMKVVVTNTGTGVARDVRISDDLPQGWTSANGRDKIMFNAGDLAAGQSREFTVSVRADRTGTFTNRAVAQEAGGLTAEASSTTRVVQPQLVLTKTAPDMRFVGRPVRFDLTVSNQGDAPARDTVLVDQVVAGTTIDGISDNGRQTDQGVVWNLETLEPGQSRQVSVDLRPSQIGRVRNTARVQSSCSEATAEASVEIKGIPAILLEVVDIDDPIEVGTNERYEISVLNQGSANDTNIVIEITLPEEQEFVSAQGPTQHGVNGKVIRFSPLPSLAPRAQAKYLVVARGMTAGDVRFKVALTSDQLTRPVEETESTNIY